MYTELAVEFEAAFVSKCLSASTVTHHFKEGVAILNKLQIYRNGIKVLEHVTKSNGFRELLLSVVPEGLIDL